MTDKQSLRADEGGVARARGFYRALVDPRHAAMAAAAAAAAARAL